MAKFLKTHNEAGVERFINLEHIQCVYPDDRTAFFDGGLISIPRDNEWNKLIKYIQNEEV